MYRSDVDVVEAVTCFWKGYYRQMHRRLSEQSGQELGERVGWVFPSRSLVHNTLLISLALKTVKWLGPGAVNPLLVDGKGGKAELIPAVRRWVVAKGRGVTLPGKDLVLFPFITSRY